jgi:hypothetical protein
VSLLTTSLISLLVEARLRLCRRPLLVSRYLDYRRVAGETDLGNLFSLVRLRVILGPSWGLAGTILAILRHLGVVLGPSWGYLGHPGAILGHHLYIPFEEQCFSEVQRLKIEASWRHNRGLGGQGGED